MSNCHPVHFHLQLLLFCNDHNERNRCDRATKTYLSKQAAPVLPAPEVPVSEASELDVACVQQPRTKRQKSRFMTVGCGEACNHAHGDAGVGSMASEGTSASSAPAIAEVPLRDGVGRDFLACDFVCPNVATMTVHIVVCSGRGWISTKCSYVPPWGTRPLPIEKLMGTSWYACGTCCGRRQLLLLDDQ